MKHFAIITLCALCAATASYPAMATEDEAEAYSEEIDHNAMPEGAAADVSIEFPPDPATIGKPRPKVKPSKVPPKEIPLIEPGYEGESSSDVSYVTGGVGDDERASIEAAKADYNLHVLSAKVDGEFVDEARVHIHRTTKEGDSEEVLDVEIGPLLYVRLPAGSYTLVADLDDQQKQQKFKVTAGGKPLTIHLSWH